MNPDPSKAVVSMRQSSRRVVLVTGSVRRSGLAIAAEFATAGYDVALHYVDPAHDIAAALREISALGASTQAFQCDLADPAAIEGLVNEVFEHFGRLDALVNNASVFFQDHLPDFTLESLDRAWQVNCRAPILLTRAFHDRARAAGTTGAVVNVVDQKVKGNFQRDHFSYTVAKTALGNLTSMLALSCAPVLRVNALFPGLMLPSDDQTEQDFAHAAAVSNLLGYCATPADLGRAAVEFSEPAYNGSELVLDAGQNLIRVDRDVIYTHRSAP